MPKYQLASGGIIINSQNNIIVIHRPKYGDWSLPKGKNKSTESLIHTAIREVEEETGIKAKAVKFQGTIAYFTDPSYKIVTYWKCDIIKEYSFVPTSEVDRTKWLSIYKANDLLTYTTEIDLVLCSYISSL